MAVTKLWPVKNRLSTVIDYATNPEKTSTTVYTEEQYQALADVISYAKDDNKTEREFFCEGINCNIITARDQFVSVKKEFKKEDGIQAYHGYMSFEEKSVTPELAQKIGMEFANKLWGDRFQVVVTTHLNTNHLHCHFVINSVSFKDGKKLHGEEKAWFKFHHIADEICKKYELNIIENPERNPDSKILTKKEKAGMPTRYNIARSALDEAISMSTSESQLEYELKKMGYGFDFNPNHKYWTITIKGDKKPIRLYRLGDEYTKARIKERLHENNYNISFKPFKPKTYKVKQYALMTRKDKIKKVGGLYGLYLHYLYRLGKLPKYQKQNPARVHYLLRDDLMKIDDLTAKTILLGKNNINSTEELYIYKGSLEKRIDDLTHERTHLRNEIRKVNIKDDELSKAKDKISLISKELNDLRKETKLCDKIISESDDMKERLDKVIADEELGERKEKTRNEHQR